VALRDKERSLRRSDEPADEGKSPGELHRRLKLPRLWLGRHHAPKACHRLEGRWRP
jgi:hypothetical protein